MVELAPSLIRGDYEEITFSVTEPDPDNEGEYRARDITNDAFVFTAKQRRSYTETVIHKTSADGIEIVDGPAGEGRISILPEDTSAVTMDRVLACDLRATPPGSPPRPYSYQFDIRVKLA
jgi:hypothetical protein